MKNLSTCIIVTRFTNGQPGYLDFAYRIEALARYYRVTLLSDRPLTVPEMKIDCVTHVVLPGGASTLGWLRYLWSVSRYIRKCQPSRVLLLHTMTVPLVYLIRRFPHAVYWNEHATRIIGYSDSSLFKAFYRRMKYRFLFMVPTKCADLVMPIGEAHRDDLIAQGCKPDKVKMIYMGVDEGFSGVALQRRRLQADAPLELIYTGTVQKERGRDVMLEAVAKAGAAGVPVRLTLVGAIPEEREYCLAHALRLGIEDRILVYGRVPGGEIPSFVAAADAGICIWEDQPWWRFNPPTKLFEYLVAGLPVLASNIRTHTQYILDGDNGMIFEYSSDSLTNAIVKLWQRRAHLDAMKQRAFESGRPYLWNNIEPVFIETMASLTRN